MKTKLDNLEQLLAGLEGDTRIKAIITAVEKGITKRKEHIETAIQFYELNKEYEKAGDITHLIQDEKALELYLKAIDYLEQKDYTTAQTILPSAKKAANILVKIGNPLKALDLLEMKALRWSKENARREAVEAFNESAKIAETQGMIEKAINLYVHAHQWDKAIGLAQEHNEIEQAVRVCEKASYAWIENSRELFAPIRTEESLNYARTYIQRAADIALENNDPQRAIQIFEKFEWRFAAVKVALKYQLKDEAQKLIHEGIYEYVHASNHCAAYKLANIVDEESIKQENFELLIREYEYDHKYSHAASLAESRGDFRKAITILKRATKYQSPADIYDHQSHAIKLIAENNLIDEENEFLKNVMSNDERGGYYPRAAKVAKMLGDDKKVDQYAKLTELLGGWNGDSWSF